VTVTRRKVADVLERRNAAKRGGRHTRLPPEILSLVPHAEVDAATVAEIGDEIRKLLDLLDDATLQRIAVWKLDGWTDQEIAAKLGCSLRTVANKLKLIRASWSDQ